jgi:Trypsin-like peptidase domain
VRHGFLKQLLSPAYRAFVSTRQQIRAQTGRHDLLQVGFLLVFGLVCGIDHVAHAEPRGFEKACTGFAQDPMLGTLWSELPETTQPPSALTVSTPRLALHGKALATRAAQPEHSTGASLESIFGVSPHEPREIVEITFHQEARAVALSPQVVATVAHALTPDSVEVKSKQQGAKMTVPLRVTWMTVEVYGDAQTRGVAADITHRNEPYDLALVHVPPQAALQPLPYPAVLSYGTGDPAKPTGGLHAGDCVAAIVPVRNAQSRDTGRQRLAVGKVLARVPVAVNSMTQTKLNVNMFTTDVDVQPGDSGSPVLALRAGKPVLVGMVAATMYPMATFTYVTRIDPLIAFARALQQTYDRSRTHKRQSKNRLDRKAGS